MLRLGREHKNSEVLGRLQAACVYRAMTATMLEIRYLEVIKENLSSQPDIEWKRVNLRGIGSVLQAWMYAASDLHLELDELQSVIAYSVKIAKERYQQCYVVSGKQ